MKKYIFLILSLITLVVLMLQLTFPVSAAESTCAEQGYTTHTGVCGENYVDSHVDATGHIYQNGICSVCGGEHPNLENYEGKVISVLGDSISTFKGYIPVADGFNEEHPYTYPGRDVKSWNQTWWGLVIDRLNAKLGINDSWSGSRVQNTYTAENPGGNVGTKVCMPSLTRISNLGTNGTPDVILVYGGTNDGKFSTFGGFDPSLDYSQVDLNAVTWKTFEEAYVAMIMRLQYFYPEAEIIVLLPTHVASWYTDEKLTVMNNSIIQICEYFDIDYVDVRECGITLEDLPDGLHPNAKGMTYIADAVLEALLNINEVNTGENIVHSVTHNLDGAKASNGHYKGVSSNTRFEEILTGDFECVSVTMNGIDITKSCYENGTICIDGVNGDIVITAKQHNYSSVVTLPTCEEQGYTTYTCECGDSYVDDYVEAVGHSFNQGFVCSDCGYTAKVSVLGDSISTFSGVSGVKNAVYPNSTVKSTSDTWWYQVVDAMGGEVLKINASGGSRILSDEYFGGTGIRNGNYAAYRDRCVDLHVGNDNPDIIFVFMGTNDFSYHVDSNCEKCKLLLSCSECTSREDGNLNVCSACRAASGVYSSFCNIPLGTADSVDISRESPTSSCEAYAIMLSKMKAACPDAEIYCLGLLPRVNTYQNAVYHDHGQPTEFNAELKKVAQNMGASFIDLEKCVDNSASSWNTYFGDAVHPTATGMDHISIAVISEILGSKVYMISSEVADGFALSGELYAIAGNTYRATISSANTDLYPNVRIAMSGNDITEAAFDPQTGEIVIDNVTGDIVISVKANIVASDEIVWSVGAVNGSNGSLVDMSNRIRTNMFDISRGAVIIASNGAEFCPIFYDKDGKFVYSPNAFDSDGLLEIPAGQYVYMRLWARNKNDINADLIPAYGENINIALGLESLSWEIGTIYCGDNATGLNADNYSNRIRTGFISISGVVYVRATSNALINVVFYDENYKILPSGNNCGFTTEWSSDNAPATTVYIRVVAKDISDMALTVAYGENIILEYGCDHNYESKVTSPTCTEQGYTTYTCSGCGDSYVDNYTEKIDHNWSNEIIIVKPTCTTDGIITYICFCGEEKTEVKPATGHIYESVVTSPICTEDGYTTYICSECGHYYVADLVNALGHTEVIDGAVAPTCTETGLTEGAHCSVCGEILVAQDIVPSIGHDYDSVITDPTCEEQGYTTHICHCGDVIVDTYVEALCHSLGEWQTEKEPTCEGKGSEARYCERCDYSEARSISPCGHSWMDEEEYEVCTSCGEIIEKDPTELEKDHSECEAGLFETIINLIINFFRTLFGLPEICVCGEEY